MNSIKSLLILAVVFVFIVGCVSPPQNGNPPPNQSSVTQNNTTPPQENQTPPDDQPPLPPSANTSNDQPPTPPNGQTDLTGKSYEALILLGIPLECNIESTYEGQTTIMKVYMQGSQTMRSEISTPESQGCTKIVGILNQGKYYMGCMEGTLFPGCDWLSIDQQITDSSSGSTGYEAPDYSEIPSSKISCLPWVYDASKFATAGKVCTLDDLMNNIPIPT